MKIRDIMTTNCAVCGPHANAAAIAEILWSRDCGSVPIVDERGILLGIVTDRDLTIALGTRDRRASTLRADECMTRDVETCNPDEDLQDALEVMLARRVRRVPIVDRDGRLEGMVSLSDIVQASSRPGAAIPAASLVSAMARIEDRSAPRKHPNLAVAAK